MYTIIGKQRKQGEYEGRKYDNTILHCSYNANNANEEGTLVCTFKVKTDICDANIGDIVSPLYDRYGNIVLLNRC